MGLEAATYISDFNASNPAAGDQQSQGDDHLRLLKTVLQTTFPNAAKAFRLPTDGAAETANFSISFPGDQNKIKRVDATSGNITVTLSTPSGANAPGWGLTVARIDSSTNTVTIQGGTINGASSYALNGQWASVDLIWIDASSVWLALPRAGFAPGVTTTFHNTNAPAGWTKQTDAGYSNAAIRTITSGTVTTGGSTGFTSVFTSRTIAQANLPAVTLSYSGNTGDESNDHTHAYGDKSNPGTTGTTGGGAIGQTITDSSRNTGGRSEGHTHAYSGNTSALGSGTAMDFAVKYLEMIVATKV